MIHTATWHGKVIASSDSTLEVGGYRYFPRDSVKMDLLKSTPKTPSDLECPHGVQFYDVVEDGLKEPARGAWSYEGATAQDEAGRPLDRSFGKDVEIK